MLKVSLIIDCDGCRRLFPFSRFVSEDITAWQLHRRTLESMAEEGDWEMSECGNFHYCPSCSKDLLELIMAQHT
jgi:hypothetical protein